MEVGALFPSYEAFSAALMDYQKTNFVNFWMKSTRTIVGARKKGIKRFVKDELHFYEITCSCVHGGRIHKSKSAGIRPQQRTLKFGCPAELKVAVSKDGQHLEVKSAIHQHNHPRNEMAYKQMLKQKRLLNETADVKAVPSVRRKRRRIKSFLSSPEIVELLQGQSNSAEVSSTMDDNTDRIAASTIETLVAEVQTNGGVMDVLIDGSENLVGIFYQDQYMCNAFKCFPEVVFVETICRSEQTKPIYLVSVEDSNSDIAVVAVLLCALNEVGAVFERLSIHCGDSAISRTKVVMTNRDFLCHDVLKEVFPNATQVLSVSRMLRTFKKDVTVNKMSLSASERHTALDIVQRMCYVQHEDQYDMLLEELECIGNQRLTSYFMDNWHNIRHQWVQGLQGNSVAFINRSNTRVEHISNRITGVITKYKSVGDMFRYLIIVIKSLHQERYQRILDALLRQPTYPEISNTERYYGELLTPYAFNVVATQLRHSTTMDRLGGTTVQGSTHNCECPLWSVMELPCKHILYHRSIAGLDLFFPSGVGRRWTRQYYKDSCRAGDTEASDDHVRGILSEEEKYREVSALTEELATKISKLPMEKYQVLLATVSRMVEHVAKGADVDISEVVATV